MADYPPMKIAGTGFRMPLPADLPDDMPSVMRDFEAPVTYFHDGTPDYDQGEALFDAVVDYFKVDIDDPEAGWQLAWDLLRLILPGCHQISESDGLTSSRKSKKAAPVQIRCRMAMQALYGNIPTIEEARDVELHQAVANWFSHPDRAWDPPNIRTVRRAAGREKANGP